MYKKHTNLGDKTRELGKEVADYTEKTTKQVGKQIDTLSDLAKEYKTLLENYTRHYPLKTIGISLLIGAALAIFLRGFSKTKLPEK
jgi:ElaB/YqjD/DUF883 family membrane-anchored ribosome-binding protein